MSLIQEPGVVVAQARADFARENERSNNVVMFSVNRTDPKPTLEQKVSGDYAKRKVGWQGLTIAIENESGSTRSGTNRDGEKWTQKMPFAYGEIHQTEGVDGDPVDCFLGPDEDAQFVYVVHARKVNRWDEYDEDKVMLNFSTEQEAAAAFLSCYSDPRFLGPITCMPVIEFIQKVKNTNGRPTMIKAGLFFCKAHVKGYTRKDGTYVPPHDDNRRAAGNKGANAHAHATLENVEKLAGKISKNYPGVSAADARNLAEFNLRHSSNYAEAAARADAPSGKDAEPQDSWRIKAGRRLQSKDDAADGGGFALEPPPSKDEPDDADDESLTSKEYEAALAVMSAADQAFGAVRDKYRAQKVGDQEFLAAKKIHNEAVKVFDAAYAKEEDRERK